MVKHIIIWNLKDELSDAEKQERKQLIKQGLESLIGKIDGLVEIKVITELLGSSTGDLMLDSTFESAEALITDADELIDECAENAVLTVLGVDERRNGR